MYVRLPCFIQPIAISFTLCFTLFSISVSAQDSSGTEGLIIGELDINKTVAVIPFSTSFDYDSDQEDYSKMITERIQTSLVQTERFIMVERIDFEKVLKISKDQNDKNVQEHRYWKNITNSHLVKAGRQLGVEYIFTGNILSVATPIVVSGGYAAEYSFDIKVISVETGELYVTESFKAGSEKLLGKNSKREALIAALDRVVEPVKKFVDKNFPIEAPVYRLKDFNKKGFPKTIVLKGGLSNGLRNGQSLDIAVIDKHDPEYKDKIGEAEIIEISAKYATCKVKSGADQIKRNFENNKDLLIAKSRAYDKKGIFKGGKN